MRRERGEQTINSGLVALERQVVAELSVGEEKAGVVSGGGEWASAEHRTFRENRWRRNKGSLTCP